MEFKSECFWKIYAMADMYCLILCLTFLQEGQEEFCHRLCYAKEGPNSRIDARVVANVDLWTHAQTDEKPNH